MADLWERLADVDPARRLVVVPVGELDLRAKAALDYAARISARERKAVHVAVDQDGLWRLGQMWMANAVGWPLHTVENDGGVARTMAKTVEFELASGFDQVVVLAGRVGFRRRTALLLHDRTADRIGSAVARLPGALAAVMNVRTL